MIESILRLAIERRFLFLSFILVIVGIGVWSYQKLPIDAVPDITNVQVLIWHIFVKATCLSQRRLLPAKLRHA